MNRMSSLLERLIQAVADWMARCIPEYEPAAWNDGGPIQHWNNCYNYACDLPTGTYAQPGRAAGSMYASIDCVEVGKGAQADGLTSTNCAEGCGCSECCHLVALAIWPQPHAFDNVDYHWYRRDRDGKWSHKPGGTPATNLDNSGNVITDPQTADRGPYTVFCGCYCVCKENVTVN